MITPAINASHDTWRKAVGSHDSVSKARAMPVVRRLSPRSAQRPAFEAARAPATPARPNRPIWVWDNDSGAALRGNTIAVHNTLNAAKINKASRPRVRRVRSVTSSANNEPINLT